MLPECVVTLILNTYKKSDLTKALAIFLEQKTKIDPNDLISIYFIDNPNQLLKSFETTPKDAFIKIKSVKYISPLPNPSDIQDMITSSIKSAIEILSDRIKQLGSNIYRIFFLTDYPQLFLTPNIQNYIKNASGLGISIDICLFHEEKANFSLNEYRELADSTHGEFGHFYKTKTLFDAAKGFASKKITESSPIRLLSSEEKRDDNALAELATPLQFLSEDFLQNYDSKKSTIKCQVCFGSKCPTDGQDFIFCGRLCPNCGRHFHLHCAGMWAQKAEVAPNLFRCPACYSLLKLPPSIQLGLKIKEIRKSKNIPTADIKMVRVKNESLTDTLEVCSFCFKVFSPLGGNEVDQTTLVDGQNELKIFKCSACNAHYHTKCLEAMYKENKSCKNCGGIIK